MELFFINSHMHEISSSVSIDEPLQRHATMCKMSDSQWFFLFFFHVFCYLNEKPARAKRISLVESKSLEGDTRNGNSPRGEQTAHICLVVQHWEGESCC